MLKASTKDSGKNVLFLFYKKNLKLYLLYSMKTETILPIMSL